MRMIGFVGALAITAMTAGTALAAPCNTGSTKGKTPDQTMNEKSSDMDKGSKNLAGGQQPASPGTVGAMNNAGANQGLGDKSGATGTSKNMAGGNQPSSPGTVGAMNNSGTDQKLAKGDDDC